MPTEEMFQVDPKAPLFPSEECTVGKASRTLLIPFNLYYIINLMLKKKKKNKKLACSYKIYPFPHLDNNV